MARSADKPRDEARRPTVLLLHETAEGRHYDWMLRDPTIGEGVDRCLWAARVALPSEGWAAAGELEIEPIEHHREAYLTFEGELSGGRGSVSRADEGTFRVLAWDAKRIEVEIAMRGFSGRAVVRRGGGRACRAAFEAKPPKPCPP